MDWQKEVEHSARITKVMLTHLGIAISKTSRQEMCLGREATDEDVPR